MIEITLPGGEKRQVNISHFPALDGWEIQHRFVEFAAASDRHSRREFTLEVLSYATVKVGANDMPLSTDALIDNHLRSWENIAEVFEAVLMFNGIDPKTHANQPRYWAEVGEQMAVAFWSTASELLGPALASISAAAENKG